jgi:hypothetical protein
MLLGSVSIVLGAGGAAIGAPARQAPDVVWSAVQDAVGRSSTMMPGDVYRIGMPRTDLKVTVEGVPVQAGLALGAYAAAACGHPDRSAVRHPHPRRRL